VCCNIVASAAGNSPTRATPPKAPRHRIGYRYRLLRPLVTPDAVYPVGMSMNMAVHPDHRGRGLIKLVSAPVYDAVKAVGGVMGLGFSNAVGVKVDRHSKGYGYQVIGQMRPSFHLLGGHPTDGLTLHDHFPTAPLCIDAHPPTGWHFAKTEAYLRTRYGAHPFRRYQYGVWQKAGQVLGVVVYRRASLLGMPTAAVLEVVGGDSAGLIARWSATMRGRGVWVAHLLSTPSAAVRRTFGATLAPVVARTPSYLTIKPLSDGLPTAAWSLATWDFVGGDVL